MISGSARVDQLMRRRFVTIAPEETLLEAHQVMRLARLRHLVVASDGILVGLLSFRDIQDRLLAQIEEKGADGVREYLTSLRVEDVMVRPAESTAPETPLAEAATHMMRLRTGCLPVAVETRAGPRLVGLLTEMDLLRAAYDRWIRVEVD